ARYPPVSRLHSNNVAERSGLPYASSRLRAQGKRSHARSYCHGAPPAASARHALEIIGIARYLIRRILRRRAHCELVAIGLADHHRTARFQTIDYRGAVWWNVV